MERRAYRYILSDSVPIPAVEAALDLALAGAQALHSETQVTLDARCLLDSARRALVIDAATPTGQAVNRLFVKFLEAEFGEEAFRVEGVDAQTTKPGVTP